MTRRRWLSALSAVLALTWFANPAEAEQAMPGGGSAQGIAAGKNIPQFGGPNAVGSTIIEDALNRSTTVPGTPRLTPLESWFAFKERLNDQHGLTLGLDYSALAQHYSGGAIDENDAVGGIGRFYGTWSLYGRENSNTGNIVFKVENRHRITTELAPQDAGIAAGSTLPTGTAFSNINGALTNLFFQHRLADGNFTVLAGMADVTDYLDVYGLISPWMHFQNLAFLTSPAIAAPNQGLGIAAGGMLTSNIYAVAGLADANGDPTLSVNPFDSFFDTKEYFSHAEIGWTSGKERIYLDNVHLTYWRVDEREAVGIDESEGLAASAAWFINEKWLPFVRAGWSRGPAAAMKRTLAGGLGLRRENKDVVGIGIAWGDPSIAELREQKTGEIFYRWQMTDVLAITPNVQIIWDPALNSDENRIAIFGFRTRFSM